MRPICFLSDFGLADDFVGSCKGVMAKISPGLQILDLTHEVPGFEIEMGAEVLQHATRYMPQDTVYLAVVDPGVGTQRRGLALSTQDGALLVGPDNGLLIPAAGSLGGILKSVALTNTDYHVHPVSNTFHGRDIFSPVAAHLAAGTDISDLGNVVDPSGLQSSRVPGIEEDRATGTRTARIISIDRFGNARLSILEKDANLQYGTSLKVDTGDGDMSVRYVETFGAAQAGELVLVPDSHWRLSISINKGNASHALGMKVGARVRLKNPTGGSDART